MKNTKKLISAVLLTALLLSCLAGCGGSVKKQATVEGSIFGGKSNDSIELELRFDPKWITTADNSAYNAELARFCVLFSADSYFRQKDLDKGRQNRVLLPGNADYGFTTFLDTLGFTETEHYESYLVSDSLADSDDSVTLNMGHMTLKGKYDVYAVAVRGCFSWQEWSSAFDPGCGAEAYGEHPEWTNRAHQKGLDVAANRALGFIDSFMAEHNDPALPDCLLITGHSRGGGIANILGAHFERETSVRSYTYTFSAMNVTDDAHAADCQTVFNLFDSDDLFVNALPFGSEPFCRYGTDLTLSVSDSAEAQAAAAKLKGREDYTCVPAESAAEYCRLFAERFPDRDMLCETVSISRTYDTQAEAEAALEELRVLLGSESGLAVEGLCTLSDAAKTPDGKYGFRFDYNGLALLRSYARILAYGDAAAEVFAKVFAEDETACALSRLIAENAVGISGAHQLINCYAITDLVK